MITAHPYVSRLAACSLIIIVSPRAHAECAWVLWNDELRLDFATGIESRSWHSIASASKKPECEARLREEIGSVTRLERTSRAQTFRYVCLPSTVDPRTPQAK